MFQWFNKNEKEVIASIYPTNITINKPGMSHLESAYAAMLGVDEEEKLVAIKPLTKDEYDSKVYTPGCLFILSGGKTYTRVSSTEFVNRIAAVIPYDFKNGMKKYLCHYDAKEGILVIDLKKEV
ncbi:MAG: hypothetical protein IJ194_06250 [Bacilli bacterium]|jgi:Zn-dependent M28 family amino/carboxypeptidase|nr:hypothetical protein [Bacilli bacterium]